MTAVVWALFALLAGTLGVLAGAVFAAFSRLDGRFDGLRAELGPRIDNLGIDLREEIRGLRGDISALDARLTRAGG